MNRMNQEILQHVVFWLEAGQHAFLVTIVKTGGPLSLSYPVGTQLAVSSDGHLVGSVSGGYVEEDLREHLQIESPHRPEVLTYGVSAESPRNSLLPGGDTLQLVIEPVRTVTSLKQTLEAIEHRREVVCRHLDMASGYAETFPAQPGNQLQFDGKTLITVYSPRWRLLLIGATPLAHYLAQMALTLDYQVIVCDPRPEYADSWDVPGAELRTEIPARTVQALLPDPCCALITLTQDPALDDRAIEAALSSAFFYVGATGSQTSHDQRRERLALHFGLTPAQLSRLHAPAGLPLGAYTPPEMALSILAEITALRHAQNRAATTSTKQALATAP